MDCPLYLLTHNHPISFGKLRHSVETVEQTLNILGLHIYFIWPGNTARIILKQVNGWLTYHDMWWKVKELMDMLDHVVYSY